MLRHQLRDQPLRRGAPAKQVKPQDPVEPARAALRTLQFDKAIALLNGAGNAGNADAQYLLALIYLNGVGVPADAARGRALLQTAAEHGHGEAAYVLAGELARAPEAAPDAWRQWLDRSAKLGYYRAVDAQRSGRPLLDRESVGASDPNLLTPWVMDCVRKNDAAELRRLGPVSASVRDEFGRSSLAHAAEDGATAAATVLLEMGADARAVDQAGTTVLMIAAERPDAAMIDLLLKHGADLHAVDGERRTALFYAARADRVDNIIALQRAGAALDVRDNRGYNAYDAAMVVGAEAAVTELGTLGLHANRVTVDPARQGGKFDAGHPGEIYRGWPPLALAVARNDTANVATAAGGRSRCEPAAAAGRPSIASGRGCSRAAQHAAAAGARRRRDRDRSFRPQLALACRNAQRPGRRQDTAGGGRTAGRACSGRADAFPRSTARQTSGGGGSSCLLRARVSRPPTPKATPR